MKIYSWNTQKISINDNGQIKTIAPFFLVSDDKAALFENNNFTEIGSFFNIDEIKQISSDITAVSENINNTINEKTANLLLLQEKVENTFNKIENMIKELDELKSIKDTFLEINKKAEENYNNIKQETAKYIEQLSEFQNNTDEKIKSAETAFNKAKVDISDLMEQAENKVAAKYMAVRLNMENIYNKYINAAANHTDKCRQYAETSKKWATNPVNSPVENGEYSARHYAALAKNKEIVNG